MITFLGLQKREDDEDPQGKYGSRTGEPFSKVPIFIALMLTAIGAFLKSATAGNAAEFSASPRSGAAPEDGGAPASEETAGRPRAAQSEDDQRGREPYAADDLDFQSASFGGSNILPFQPNMRGFLVGDGAIQYAAPQSRHSLVAFDRSGVAHGVTPMNDFGGGSISPSAPRSRDRAPSETPPDAPPETPPQEAAPPTDNSEPPPPADDDDDETPQPPDPPEEERRNRAPHVPSSIRLSDVIAGQAILIGIAELLGDATDPDGDELSILNVSVSHGTLLAYEGFWVYTAAAGFAGTVNVMYKVTDGIAQIGQSAFFAVGDLIDGPPPAGGPEDDHVEGDTLANSIRTYDGDDWIDAMAGDDLIEAGVGNDIVYAGAGNDVVWAGAGDDQVWGGEGDDRIMGEAGDDVLVGDAGDDIIEGGEGDDRIEGSDGQDILQGDAGRDLLDGGDGDDQLAGGLDDDFLAGGAGNDDLAGDTGDDVLSGDAGNDTIAGGEGDDRAEGGEGQDTLLGDAGRDILDGGEDDDEIAGGEGDDLLAGGEGNDDLSGDTGDDTLHGAAGDDSLSGGEGADSLFGGEGDDDIAADAGDDYIEGEAGEDRIDAGAGADIVAAGSDADVIIVTLDETADVYDGGEDTDPGIEESVDVLDASLATEDLTIDLVVQVISSEATGEDSIANFEAITAGSGNDTLIVGAEAVLLTGGEGNDSFLFGRAQSLEPVDQELVHHIVDFMIGDMIKLDNLELTEAARDLATDLYQDFYEHRDALTGKSVSLRFRHERIDDMDHTMVDVDFDSDAVIDLSIDIYGLHRPYIYDTAQA